MHAALAPGYFRPRGPAARSPSDASVATLVAEADGAVRAPGAAPAADAPLLGAVVVRIYDTPADPAMVPRRRAHIEALVVDRERRRAGVGTALMDAATDWARAGGAEEVVLTVWAGNHAAEAFYDRLGYGVVSRALAKPIR